jgi:hypothetical protein
MNEFKNKNAANHKVGGGVLEARVGLFLAESQERGVFPDETLMKTYAAAGGKLDRTLLSTLANLKKAKVDINGYIQDRVAELQMMPPEDVKLVKGFESALSRVSKAHGKVPKRLYPNLDAELIREVVSKLTEIPTE